MCGRYVLKASLKQLIDIYSAKPAEEIEFSPVYNVPPTFNMPVIHQNGDRSISSFRWGFVPHWSKGPDSRYTMINARSETLAEKPAYREAYKKRRCIVPASGFYEWKKTPDGKLPHYIFPTEGELFSFAGLHEHWEGEDQSIDSYTIITTDANKAMNGLHDRMPAILLGDEIDQWMDPESDTKSLQDLLRPAPDDLINHYPVSKAVNTPRNQGKELIDPAQDLFT